MKYQCGKCNNIMEVAGIKENIVTCSGCGSRNSIAIKEEAETKDKYQMRKFNVNDIKDASTNRLPAGKYYIGDPCYVIGRGADSAGWVPFLEKTEYGDGRTWRVVNVDGAVGYISYNKTKYGDGKYTDEDYKYEFPVDAGLIGIVSLNLIPMFALSNAKSSGAIVNFTSSFEISSRDGYFKFGKIVINTDDEPEDEDED